MTAMNLLRIPMILGCVLACASIGTAVQALRITGTPQEFRSLARIKVPVHHAIRDDAERIGRNSVIVETIESPELKRRASNRVNALNPGLQAGDVTIRADQALDSDVFNILVTGTEPKGTRLFLDALLDEFVAFRITVSSLSNPPPPKEYLQSLTVVLQHASPATEYLEDWRLPIAMGAGGGGLLGGLVGLVLSLLLVRSPKPPQIPAAP